MHARAPIVSAWLALAAPGIAPAEPGAAKVERASGLHTTIFDTAHGRVVVHLPDDLAAGDTIAGTVVAIPAGSTEKERRKNAATLSGCVVEAPETEARSAGGVLKVAIPAALTSGLRLVLRDPKGKSLGGVEVPVVPAAPSPPDFTLPRLGQAGRAVEIQGPFNGDFAGTAVKVGGQTATLRAESPRKLVAESPSEVTGPSEIEVTEGGRTARGPYRAIGHDLSAGKLTLRPGEGTILTDRVSGLVGLEAPIQLRLVNHSAEVVRMEGGDEQTIVVHPDDVEPDGTAELSRALTGVRLGDFTITAEGPVLEVAQDLARLPHAYETSMTWASKAHVVAESGTWPPGHDVWKSVRGRAPEEHADKLSNQWDENEHSHATSKRWEGGKHYFESSIQWRDGHDKHDIDESMQWRHHPHVYVDSRKEKAGKHAVATTRRWRGDRHWFSDSEKWDRDGHAYDKSMDEKADLHEHSDLRTDKWTEDEHASARSRKWQATLHSYTESRKWDRQEHLEDTSRSWSADGHHYELTRSWQDGS